MGCTDCFGIQPSLTQTTSSGPPGDLSLRPLVYYMRTLHIQVCVGYFQDARLSMTPTHQPVAEVEHVITGDQRGGELVSPVGVKNVELLGGGTGHFVRAEA